MSKEDPDNKFFTSVTFKDGEGNVGQTAAVLIPGDRGIDGEFYHDYRIITEIPMHGHWDDDEEGFVAEDEDDKNVAYCINCGTGYDQEDWDDIQKGCELLKQPTTCWCGNDYLGKEGEETIKTPCCSEVVHEHSVEMCEDCNKCLVIRLGSGYEDGCCKCICIEVPSCGNIRNECVC